MKHFWLLPQICKRLMGYCRHPAGQQLGHSSLWMLKCANVWFWNVLDFEGASTKNFRWVWISARLTSRFLQVSWKSCDAVIQGGSHLRLSNWYHLLGGCRATLAATSILIIFYIHSEMISLRPKTHTASMLWLEFRPSVKIKSPSSQPYSFFHITCRCQLHISLDKSFPFFLKHLTRD